MSKAEGANAQLNNSSFRGSNSSRTMGVNSESHDESLNESNNQLTDDEKVLEESKRFMNYLKAVKNIVPAFADNENTNKLINIMEQLKKSDSDGIVGLMKTLNNSKNLVQQTTTQSQHSNDEYKENKYGNANTELNFNTPEVRDRYMTQPRMEESKTQARPLILPESDNLNYASFKARQAYNTLVNGIEGDSLGQNSSERFAKMNSEELSELVRSSQK